MQTDLELNSQRKAPILLSPVTHYSPFTFCLIQALDSLTKLQKSEGEQSLCLLSKCPQSICIFQVITVITIIITVTPVAIILMVTTLPLPDSHYSSHVPPPTAIIPPTIPIAVSIP